MVFNGLGWFEVKKGKPLALGEPQTIVNHRKPFYKPCWFYRKPFEKRCFLLLKTIGIEALPEEDDFIDGY